MAKRRNVTLGCAAAVAMAAPAQAQTVVEAQVVWRFDALSYTIDQGGAVLFRNRDAASPGPHNVTASDSGADGRPLFASSTVGNGQDAPVTGAERLVTGSYPFICTVHPFMQATLVVTAQGTPATDPPPPPPPSAPPAQPAAADTQPPLVTAALRGKLRARSLRLRLEADEPATAEAVMTVRARGRTLRVGRVTTQLQGAGRPVTVTVRVSARARRALARLRSARVQTVVTARDAAGNRSTKRFRTTLRR